MRLRVDGGKAAFAETDPDQKRPPRRGGDRPVVEASAIAQAIVLRIEADQRRDEDIGKNGGPVRRHGNVPVAPLQLISRTPEAEFERPSHLDDDRQGEPRPLPADAFGPVVEIGLRLDRPVEADDVAVGAPDDSVQLRSNPFGFRLTLRSLHVAPLRDQRLPCYLAPGGDIAPPFRTALELRYLALSRLQVHMRRFAVRHFSNPDQPYRQGLASPTLLFQIIAGKMKDKWN